MLQPVNSKTKPKFNIWLIGVCLVLVAGAVFWLRTNSVSQSVPLVSVTKSTTSSNNLTSNSVNCLPANNSPTVKIKILNSKLTPSCQSVSANQTIEIDNLSNKAIRGQIADNNFSIQPNHNYRNEMAISKYFSRGIHYISIDGVGKSELWLK